MHVLMLVAAISNSRAEFKCITPPPGEDISGGGRADGSEGRRHAGIATREEEGGGTTLGPGACVCAARYVGLLFI